MNTPNVVSPVAVRARGLPGRLIKHVNRQREGVARGGWSYLRWKAQLLLPLPVAIFVVLVVRALRPLVLVRFRCLHSTRMGHLAANTELYMCERDAGLHAPRSVDIFFHLPPVCNQQLKKMWDRRLRTSYLVASLDLVNRRLPGGKRHIIPLGSDVDYLGLLGRTDPHISFTPKEEQLGQAGLRALNIPEGAEFICFFARDAAYMDSLTQQPGNFHYLDFLNSDINNYLPAAEELARRGYFAIRMGAVVNQAVNTDNPMIIDYATTARTDFLDIYLLAKCRLFLGGSSGINAVPRVFRRPIAYTNFVPLSPRHLLSCAPGSVLIPKKYWLREEGRWMTFPELVRENVGDYWQAQLFERRNIDIVENTPEEIAAVALELEGRLNGTWQTTEEDEQLQRRFWELFMHPNRSINGWKARPELVAEVWWETHPQSTSEFLPRIGADFLRQDRQLLD